LDGLRIALPLNLTVTFSLAFLLMRVRLEYLQLDFSFTVLRARVLLPSRVKREQVDRPRVREDIAEHRLDDALGSVKALKPVVDDRDASVLEARALYSGGGWRRRR